MDWSELLRRQPRNHSMKKRIKKGAGMLGGKLVC
jgi:hypothetical protein